MVHPLWITIKCGCWVSYANLRGLHQACATALIALWFFVYQSKRCALGIKPENMVGRHRLELWTKGL